jgi:hypothetical protein
VREEEEEEKEDGDVDELEEERVDMAKKLAHLFVS